MEIDTPKEWHAVLNDLEKERGVAIILGATDTGKSTLAQFLIRNLCKKGLKVALVDADIGQSFLGPPATIGFSLFKSHPDWEIILSTPEIFFVGSTTPEGHFPVFLKGVKRMLDKATCSEAEVVLIDTTGFVLGEAGKELKRRKIDLISPKFFLILQRSDEMEPILKLYKENPIFKIYRLPLSDRVKPRSMEERRIYRNNRFQDYFKHSMVQEFDIHDVRIEGEVLDPNGEPLPLEWALRINGILIGLKGSDDETLSLGLIRNYSEEKKILRILTPLQDIQKVNTIQLSSLKVILLHEEDRI